MMIEWLQRNKLWLALGGLLLTPVVAYAVAISGLTALTTGNTASGDQLVIVDVSEPAAADRTKNITLSALFGGIPVDANWGNAAGPSVLNEAASVTNPTLVPDKTDLDTGIGGDGANALSLITGGTEAIRIDSSQNVLVLNGNSLVVGHASQITATNASELQILGTAGPDSTILTGRWTSNEFGPGINFLKSRNTVIGSNTIVSDGDEIGKLRFLPDDGVDFATVAATLVVEVDDPSPAAGDIGTAFVWNQMPGGGGALAETLRISASGSVTKPSNACFLAFNSADDANVTGASATVTIDFDTEVFDQGADFATDTFTAPVTGRYQFNTNVRFSGLTGAADLAVLEIDTSNRNYRNQLTRTNDMPSLMTLTLSVIADMDASDTATVTLQVQGESSDIVDVDGNATTLITSFSGCLLS